MYLGAWYFLPAYVSTAAPQSSSSCTCCGYCNVDPATTIYVHMYHDFCHCTVLVIRIPTTYVHTLAHIRIMQNNSRGVVSDWEALGTRERGRGHGHATWLAKCHPLKAPCSKTSNVKGIPPSIFWDGRWDGFVLSWICGASTNAGAGYLANLALALAGYAHSKELVPDLSVS